MYKLTVLVLLLVLGIQTPCQEPIKIDIAAVLEATEEPKLSYFTDEITYVKLETNDNCIIGNVGTVRRVGDKLVIHDRSTQRILVFSDTGRYLNHISQIGRGPGEYVNIRNGFTVDPLTNDVIIVNLGRKVLIRYRLDGTFLGEIKLDHYTSRLGFIGDKLICYTSSAMAVRSQKSHLITVMDRDGNKLGNFHKAKKLYYNPIDFQVRSYNHKGSFRFWEKPFNAVYEFDGKTIKKAFTIDFGGDGMPEEMFYNSKYTKKILCYQDLTQTNDEIKDTFSQIGVNLSGDLMHDLYNMQQATNLGSLIIPLASQNELEMILVAVNDKAHNTDAFLSYNLRHLKQALVHLKQLGNKYHCIVDNPPYMGGGKMNKSLSDWVKIHYPKSKADLMVCFMNRAQYQVMQSGFVGMINLPSWMFLSSFEDYRKELIGAYGIDTLLHLGRGIFGSDFGTVAFTLIKSKGYSLNGVYRRLFKKHVQVRSVEKIRSLFLDNDYGYYNAKQKDFEKIPGSPIGYWLSINLTNAFKNGQALDSFTLIRQGLASGNNDFFLRVWTEVNSKGFNKSSKNIYEAVHSQSKWFPYNKGGEFRKWTGNIEYVILFNKYGFDLLSKSGNNLPSRTLYFKQALTWTAISSGNFSVRIHPEGTIFSNAGMVCITPEDYYNTLLAFFNTKVVNLILGALSPTLNYNAGDIKKLPFLKADLFSINSLTKNSCEISNDDWNSHETSWDFDKSELIRITAQDTSAVLNSSIEETYTLYQQFWKNQFFQLHKNEEELNRKFIEIYGLQEELTPDVLLEDITILKEETSIQNGELTFKAKEVFAQFVSYAVGCMFGRYSLDKEGLILANQGESLEDYLQKLHFDSAQCSFLPDEDNIIPVLDDEWFEDDITGRFYEFLKESFGKENFEKNLAFVEDALGKDIRKYFVKDFYPDHIKRYKKKPIYWMFSSPRGSFNALIYLHRYTPDTLNQILNGYLKEYREKLHSHMEQLDHLVETGSSSEQTKAAKEKDKLRLVLLELQEYERDILYPLASERISIDLDDGVLVNYNKFGNAIKPVAGLNDAKTKKKVKGFDWIDTSTII